MPPSSSNLVFADTESVVVQGDWRRLRHTVAPSSASLIYADPPFGTGRDFGSYVDDDRDGLRSNLDDLLDFAHCALRPQATLWIHLSREAANFAKASIERHPHARLLSSVIWERIPAPKPSFLGIGDVLDEILVLGYSSSTKLNLLPFDDDSKNLHRSWDNDAAPWISGDYSAPRPDQRPDEVYAIMNPFTGRFFYPPPGRRWSRSIEATQALMGEWAPGVQPIVRDDYDQRRSIGGDGVPRHHPSLGWLDLDACSSVAHHRLQQGMWPELIYGRTGRGGPRLKRYQSAPGKVASTLWRGSEVGFIRDAHADIAAEVGVNSGFTTPKPERLLRRIIEMTTQPGDLVIDPFAGSGTSAVVAHALGRRFITAERSPATVQSYVIPRLQAIDAGRHHWGDTRLAEQLPFKVWRGEASRAADVMTILESAGRLGDIDPVTLRSIRAALRQADQSVTCEPVIERRFDWRVAL